VGEKSDLLFAWSLVGNETRENLAGAVTGGNTELQTPQKVHLKEAFHPTGIIRGWSCSRGYREKARKIEKIVTKTFQVETS